MGVRRESSPSIFGLDHQTGRGACRLLERPIDVQQNHLETCRLSRQRTRSFRPCIEFSTSLFSSLLPAQSLDCWLRSTESLAVEVRPDRIGSFFHSPLFIRPWVLETRAAEQIPTAGAAPVLPRSLADPREQSLETDDDRCRTRTVRPTGAEFLACLLTLAGSSSARRRKQSIQWKKAKDDSQDTWF